MTLADAIENLKKENAELRTDIVHVRKLLRKKNKLLEQLLNVTKKRQVGPGAWLMLQKKQEEAVTKKSYFPLLTQEELDEFEKTYAVDLKIRDNIVQEVQSCIKVRGLKGSLPKILNPKLVAFYNMKGTNNMRRLLDYPNFLNILFEAVEDTGTTYEEFIPQMSRAITNIKLKVKDPLLTN